MRKTRNKPRYQGLAIAALAAVIFGLSSGPVFASTLTKFDDTPTTSESVPPSSEPESAPVTDEGSQPPAQNPEPSTDTTQDSTSTEGSETEGAVTEEETTDEDANPTVTNLRVANVMTNVAATSVGVTGTLVPWSAETNQPSYWEDYGPHDDAICYKHDENDSPNDHGDITDGGKTVTLNPYGANWPGDHYELLVIKGGSEYNNVIVHPQAGVAYASPPNSSGNQSDVSHWIVCKGTTPPPVDVCPNISGTQTTPPAGYDPVTCEPPTNGCVAGTGETFTENNPMIENDMIGSYAYSYEDGYLKIVVNDGSSKVNLRSGNPPFLLKNVGTLDILGTNVAGTENGLGLNLYVDMDGDLSTTNDRGTLVFEKVYGQDLWVPGSAANAPLAAVAPSHTGGNGSSNHGTINEWLTVIPNAKVIDWALNYGRIASTEWHVTKVVINCSDFTFDHYVTPPQEVPNNPEVVYSQECGSYTVEFSNDVTLGDNEVSTDAHFEYTDGNGTQVPVTLKPNDPHVMVTITYPEDSGTHTVTVGETGKTVEYVVESDCEPNLVPGNPQSVVKTYCGGYDVEFSNDVELGENEYADPVDFEYTDTNGTQQVVTVNPNDPHVTISVHYAEDSGTHTVTVGEAGNTEDYQIKTNCLPPELGMTGVTLVPGGLAFAAVCAVMFVLTRRSFWDRLGFVQQ